MGSRTAPRSRGSAAARMLRWKGATGGNGGTSGSGSSAHRPVMVEEVVQALAVGPEPGFYVDGTVGSGGHARIILDRSTPGGKLIGIDTDPEALVRARENLAGFGSRVLLRQGNYARLQEVLREVGVPSVRGVLLDLGASYEQLTSSERGFSFRGCGPLDMRFGPDGELTAHDIVNHWSEPELRALFRTKGQEPLAGPIARAIVRARPVRTTAQLSQIVRSVFKGRRSRIHPATRVFQALRMEVNQELSNIQAGIEAAAEVLEPGGRLCVITYHSLEDRLVKLKMREKALAGTGFRMLTPKPLRPAVEEVAANPSARSAKLRVLQRLQREERV